MTCWPPKISPQRVIPEAPSTSPYRLSKLLVDDELVVGVWNESQVRDVKGVYLA